MAMEHTAKCNWAECFLEFFEQIDATLTFRALASEANIFQKLIHKQRLILALEKLNLFITLEKKVTWVYGAHPLNIENQEKNVEADNIITKKLENLTRNIVQDLSSNEQVVDRMESFISTQRTHINESNIQEFLVVPKGKDTNCARINANLINRGVQIQRDIVDNSADFNVYSGPSNQASNVAPATNNRFSGLEERLLNMEAHLNVEIKKKEKFSVYERVSILEDRIIQLERDFPEIAKTNFNQPGIKNTREQENRTVVSKVANSIQIKFPKIIKKSNNFYYRDYNRQNKSEKKSKIKLNKLIQKKPLKIPNFYSLMNRNNVYYGIHKFSTKIFNTSLSTTLQKNRPVSITSLAIEKIRKNQQEKAKP
ncbi:hypothetical protein BB561_006311 [Smittium simulii]|uniref:Uncharacterized protein n=1 Tax=Smittium simulii TaxID=133385 RepID=A0A2T9Y548_9FUNG|nr:hypothetical protein BB561_006311 [Smittium simulii]